MAIFNKDHFESVTVNGVTNFKYTDKDAYKKGTDIPYKTLEEVAKYNSTYVQEAAEVAAQVAKDHMLKNKNVDKVAFSFGYGTSGRNSITIDVDRCKEYKNPRTGETSKTTEMKVIVKDYGIRCKPKIKELKAELTKVLI